MLRKEPVLLVTSDRAFYKNKDTKQGLADELRRDLDGVPNEFKIFPSLSDLLSEIKTGVQIAPASLVAAYMNLHGETMKTMAGRHSFVLHGEPTADVDVFATEKPASLFISFTIELPCSDATNEGRTGARIVARGEGTYNADSKEYVKLANRGEQLFYQLPDGTEKRVESIVLLAASVVIGHRTVEHSVRYEL